MLIKKANLNKSKWIGLIVEQAGIPYSKGYRRIAKPESWKPEEIIQVVDELKRF